MPMIESPPGPETVVDGRRYLYFGGTGYLGLQGHREVIQAACEAAQRYGIGSATSRSGLGTTPPVQEAERQAAAFFGCESAFYFPSGYAGNHILALHMQGQYDAVFLDELSHYCVWEAARLSQAKIVPFAHGDPDHLDAQLRSQLKSGQRPLVMTDGVFAARGDVAPLAHYRAVLAGYSGSLLVVDDAHGIGVLGPAGRGTLDHLSLFTPQVNAAAADGSDQGPWPAVFLCGTLSKAMGGYGGVIPGSRGFIERLRAGSPYFLGTSPPPCPVAAATARAIALATDPARRDRLRQNIARAQAGFQRLGLPTRTTPVPIFCFTLGDARHMRRLHQQLRRHAILVPYMPHYAGLPPEGALRLAVFATHSPAMIDRLIDTFARIL